MRFPPFTSCLLESAKHKLALQLKCSRPNCVDKRQIFTNLSIIYFNQIVGRKHKYANGVTLHSPGYTTNSGALGKRMKQ